MTTEPPLDFPAPPEPAPADPVLAKMREFKATGLSSFTEYQALCAMGQVAVDAMIQAEHECAEDRTRAVAGYIGWVMGGNPEILGELIGEAGGSLAMDIRALMATRRAVRRKA